MNHLVKPFFTLLFFACCLSASSQIYKNQWLIGGSGEFNAYKYYSSKRSELALATNSGYFFLNQLAGGLRLGYNANYSKGNAKAWNTFIQLLPFVRYYLVSPEQKINFFVDGGFGYSWGKYKSSAPYFQTLKWNSKIIAVKGGPALFLNPHTSLELTLGYNHALPNGLEDTLAANSFRVGIGFQIHLGKQKE